MCLNGWKDSNLVLGFFFYLKGYVSVWFKILEVLDEMFFEDLLVVLVKYFVLGVSEWCVR